MPTVWPFIPRDEFSETLVWGADTLRAYSAEQRFRIGKAPRQRLNFDHALSPRQYQRARLLMYNGASSEWVIPLWYEKQTFTASSGATSITCTTAYSDFRVGGVAVLWQDAETYETVTISVVGGASLTVSALSRTYTNALLMPGVQAYCVDGMSSERSVENYVSASIEFRVFGNVDLADGGLYGSYRSHPVISDAAVLGNRSVSEAVEWPHETLDNEVSEPYLDTTQSLSNVTQYAAWLTTTPAELWDVRSFLHSLYGKQKGFWLPAWTDGIDVMANITSGGSTITILAIGLDAVIEGGDVMVRTTAGVLHYFQFTSVAPSGSNEVLTLSAVAGVNITTAQIDRACLLHFCRLAAGEIEILHRNPGQASIVVECVEVPVP